MSHQKALAPAFLTPTAWTSSRPFLGQRVTIPSAARVLHSSIHHRRRRTTRVCTPCALLDPASLTQVGSTAASAATAFVTGATAANAHATATGLFDILAGTHLDFLHGGAATHALTVLADATVAVGQAAADTTATAAAGVIEAKKGGWFDSFVGVIEAALVALHDALVSIGVPQAYGFTIILFTVIIKTLTLPLNAAQMESTLKMQAMSPRMKKIQSEYKDNPAVMNQMIAQLYKDEKINPLLGCIPALVQIPVWIALYRTVLNLANENLLNESFGFLPSLQGPVSKMGASLSTWLFPLVDGAPPIGWHDALCYLVLPVLLVVSQSVSQKLLQPEQQDESAAQANAVLKFMPLLIGWFSLNVPSGLGVYWITNNLVSTLQTAFFRYKFKADHPELVASGASPSGSATDSGAEPRSAQLEPKEGFVSTAKTSSTASKTKRRKRR